MVTLLGPHVKSNTAAQPQSVALTEIIMFSQRIINSTTCLLLRFGVLFVECMAELLYWIGFNFTGVRQIQTLGQWPYTLQNSDALGSPSSVSFGRVYILYVKDVTMKS